MKAGRVSRPRRAAAPALALALALVAGSVAGSVAASVAATHRPEDPALYPAGAGGVTVYLSYNGFHSDLDVPTAFLAQGGGPAARAVARLSRGSPPRPLDGAWTAVGWGDATFYQGRGFGPRRALDLARSMFWPWNASVVRLGVEGDPTAAVAGWRVLRLTLSPAGALGLRRRLDASFTLREGEPVLTTASSAADASGVVPDVLFFESGENAWALHVCNHWTAELLNAAGVPVTPALALTSLGLAADLRWEGGATRVGGPPDPDQEGRALTPGRRTPAPAHPGAAGGTPASPPAE